MWVSSKTLLTFDQTLEIRTRGYLPQWRLDASTYAATFRLNDSLPAHVLAEIDDQREAITKTITGGREPTPHERTQIRRLTNGLIDRALDSGWGECHLRRDDIARIVVRALEHFAGTRYELLAWCVMPNHVHVVFVLLDGCTVERVIHSWKSYTATAINALLGRRGVLWQREYYSRIVRNEDELAHTIRYVLDNPAKAGMHDWPWVWPM